MGKKLKKAVPVKGILAGVLVLSMAIPVSGNMGVNVSKTVTAAEAQQAADAKVADRAIASYAFDSAEEVKNMGNPTYSLSDIQNVPGCGRVLVMGERKKKKSYGVEIANPYAGKKEYVETLADALRNNGVVYNGTVADETVPRPKYNGSEEYYNTLDTTIMPMEGRTYPRPKWEKGFTVSVWTRVPENATEDATLFMFKRRQTPDGRGSLYVRLNGATLFFEGDTEQDACRNCYEFHHDMDGTDPLALAGKWVQVTLTIENDQLEIYFNGVKASAQVEKKHVNGVTLTKQFNKGFGYRDPNFLIDNPSEAFKNYYDLIRNFSEEERAAGDFSDYEKYTFANSSGDSIIEFLTDEDTQFYLGGDNSDSVWGNAAYTDAAVGVMYDNLYFFDTVLSAEDIAALYAESPKKSDTLEGELEPDPATSPAVTAEPSESVLPSESTEPSEPAAPEDSEQPSEPAAPEDSERPSEPAVPEDSERPSEPAAPEDSEQPSEPAAPEDSEQPSEPVLPGESAEPSKSEVPSSQQPETPLAKGDVTGDGKITLDDAQLVLKAALKIEELNARQQAAADVNGDGKVNLDDAQKILKAALKIEDL